MYAKGMARLDKRTKILIQRLRKGEIAIISHQDLDPVSVEELLERGVVAVVNTSQSVSGRYPNDAPLSLIRAGVPILDEVGEEVFEKIKEGEIVEVKEEGVWFNGKKVAGGKQVTEEMIRERLEEARGRLSKELEGFVRNTLTYVAREVEAFLLPHELPPLKTNISGRHVVIVARGEGYKEDLRAISSYIKDMRPVLIAVDGGADALLESGLKPDIIVGDMDSVSDRALNCGAEIVIHAYPSGEAPGMRKIKDLGLEGRAKILPMPGISEDVALILAYEKRASLIVVVGTHFSMLEFLSKGREGMSSTFLTRLKVGDKLVDAKGVNKLYRPRAKPFQILLLLLAGMVVTFFLVAFFPRVRDFIRTLWLWLGLRP